MKKRIISLTTAAAMALSALPVLSVNANETAYPIGDVDMDGVVTGHDSALLSRAVFVGDVTLTDEQMALADVNGDGVLNTTDTEWIHENEVYPLGWLISNEHFTDVRWDTMYSAFNSIVIDSYVRLGFSKNIINLSDLTANGYDELFSWTVSDENLIISEIQYNILDADADGDVDYNDAYVFLVSNSWCCLGFDYYVGDGCYMLYYYHELIND